MEIEIGDGRGKNMTELANKNKEAVLKYFIENPGATIISCQRELSISYPTVKKYLDELASK